MAYPPNLLWERVFNSSSSYPFQEPEKLGGEYAATHFSMSQPIWKRHDKRMKQNENWNSRFVQENGHVKKTTKKLKSSPKISIQFHPHPTGYQCNQQCKKAGHMPHSAAKPPRSSWWLGNGLVETADHQLSYQCDKVVSHGKSWYSNLQ